MLGLPHPKVQEEVGVTQSRGRSISGQSFLQPEYEMPGEECGEAAGAGMVGGGPLGWAEGVVFGLPLEGSAGP